MRDIIVTTPRSEMANAAQEAADCLSAGGGHYFRALHSKPSDFGPHGRIFYVEDGYIRGFATCLHVETDVKARCETTDRQWVGACAIVMLANTWHWIKPIPMKGFQGWRYFTAPADLEVVGDWKSERPKV